MKIKGQLVQKTENNEEMEEEDTGGNRGGENQSVSYTYVNVTK